jgi:hypothetical protein
MCKKEEHQIRTTEQPRFARSIFEPNLENPCQVGGYNLKATCTFLFFVCCITSTSKRTSISVTCFEVNGEDDRIPKVIYQTILIEEPAIYFLILASTTLSFIFNSSKLL